MSQSKAKKVRQMYRRDIRTKLGLEVELAKKLVKPKPRWFPSALWWIGAKIYFNEELLKKWFSNKN